MRRKVVFAEARKAFHSRLVQDGILCFDKEGGVQCRQEQCVFLRNRRRHCARA